MAQTHLPIVQFTLNGFTGNQLWSVVQTYYVTGDTTPLITNLIEEPPLITWAVDGLEAARTEIWSQFGVNFLLALPQSAFVTGYSICGLAAAPNMGPPTIQHEVQLGRSLPLFFVEPDPLPGTNAASDAADLQSCGGITFLTSYNRRQEKCFVPSAPDGSIVNGIIQSTYNTRLEALAADMWGEDGNYVRCGLSKIGLLWYVLAVVSTRVSQIPWSQNKRRK